MEWLNFRHLYAFWAVCRHGGFQKAAKRLRVSQSTISAQVAALEGYLDAVLIERNTRSLAVTDRGAALLAHADDIFSTSQTINELFRDRNATSAPPPLRVGMVGGISRNFVYRRVAARLQARPDVGFDIVDGSFDELEAMLRAFELDLFFSLDRPRHQDLLTVIHEKVATSPLCLAGTPHWLDRHAVVEPLPLFLFRHPFDGDPLEELVSDRLGLATQVRVRTDDISLLRFLANSGHGLAVVPEMGVAEDLAAGRVVRVEALHEHAVDVFAVFLARGFRRDRIDDLIGSRG